MGGRKSGFVVRINEDRSSEKQKRSGVWRTGYTAKKN